MTHAELLVVSLGLSLALAALGLGAVGVIERIVRDPELRDRAWAAALYVSALPPMMVGLLLLGPAPEAEEASQAQSFTAVFVAPMDVPTGADVLSRLDTHATAIVILVLAAILAFARTVQLTIRALRLRRLVATSVLAAPDLSQVVHGVAARLGVTAPEVRVNDAAGAALLVGLRAPVLIVPSALAAEPAGAAASAVCAHELAHLKRGDHRALWAEEILLILLAANPLLVALRQRRGAAREEACDALALSGAAPGARRLYAHVLIEALKTPTLRNDFPALTFTRAKRTFAMLRLKAILDPATPAAPHVRQAAFGIGALIAAAALTGSIAVAAQREPVPAEPPIVLSAPPTTVAKPSAPPVETPPSATAVGPATSPVEAQPKAAPATPGVERDVAPLQDAGQAAPRSAILNPSWAQHPMATFPAAAFEQGITQASVTLSCSLRQGGRLSNCSVVSEDPAGHGFGAAAVQAAGAARVAETSIDGASPASTVTFTIRFRAA